LNPQLQDQNLLCCQLHHPRIGRRKDTINRRDKQPGATAALFHQLRGPLQPLHRPVLTEGEDRLE
jgi:hypothetical protein